AETDVAANQTIHRAAGGEIFEHSGNCSVLILGFVVGKARTEFVIEALRRREFRRLAEFARGGDTYELRGNFTDAALELRFPRLPAHAAEAVELHRRVLVAVAGEQFKVFDGKKQPRVVGVMDFETIVRRAKRL